MVFKDLIVVFSGHPIKESDRLLCQHVSQPNGEDLNLLTEFLPQPVKVFKDYIIMSTVMTSSTVQNGPKCLITDLALLIMDLLIAGNKILSG